MSASGLPALVTLIMQHAANAAHSAGYNSRRIYSLIKDVFLNLIVKQTIGPRKLETTSAYVTKLSDQERQNRIDQLE